MKKNIFIFLLLLIIPTNYMLTAADQSDDIDLIIGQMLMIGFRGCDLSDDAQIIDDIKNHNLGGVVLFDYDMILKQRNRNIKDPVQLTSLVKKLKSNAAFPLLIAIDQEGGRVNRLKTDYGFPQTYSAQFLGNLNDMDRIKTEGAAIGKTLSELGINLNLAPVVDLNTNPDNPAIGKLERSFSAEPGITSSCAQAFIEGLHQHNILSCIKHFPGHGSSYNDSHKGMTDVTDTWKDTELLPYENLIKSNSCDLIMTAHIFNAKLDARYPATLSKKTITGILRNKYGYSGVIITDDMQMLAIQKYFGLKKAVYLAIDAGADIILFGNNLSYDPDIMQKYTAIVKQLIKEKKITKERLMESYERIMLLKNKISQ